MVCVTYIFVTFSWERKWRKFIGLHLKITFLDGVYVLDEFEEKKYKVPGFSGLQSRDIHTKCSKNRAVRRLQGKSYTSLKTYNRNVIADLELILI